MGQAHKDMKKYVRRCMSDAEKGKIDAYYDLGLLFSTGQGVDLDYVTAHKWFNLAAIKGHRRAKIDRAELAEDMSPHEIEEAQRQAREWISLH